MADFVRKNKEKVSEFKKNVRELKAELYEQIMWAREYGDLYNSNIKENDFVVEGFTPEGKLKLVMVDFQ
jgi:hypothetical protein